MTARRRFLLRLLLPFRRSEVRVEFLEDLVARALDIHFEILQHACRHAFALAEQAKQDMLRADVGMVEGARFLAGEREHFFDSRRIGNVTDHFRFWAGADLFFDLHSDGFEVEPHLLEDVDGDALAKLDQPEQKMLGAHVIVVEAIGFLTGESQNLLRAWSEVIHC